MQLKCPSCANEVPVGQRYCPLCGFDMLAGTGADAASRQTSQAPVPPSPFPPPGATRAAIFAPSYPYSRLAGQSIMSVLVPAGSARRVFWVGLSMLLAGLFLLACPLMLGIALAIGESDQNGGQLFLGALSISGCSIVVLLLPGAVLVLAGRPRR